MNRKILISIEDDDVALKRQGGWAKWEMIEPYQPCRPTARPRRAPESPLH